MRSAISISFIGAFALVAALIGGAEASDLSSCAKLKDGAERLACYDLLAKYTLSGETGKPSANESDEATERERIVSRCREEMGEHGSAMVKYCVVEVIAAYQALQSYPAEFRPFVERCNREMGRYGWAMVKFCADEDIDAERALGDMLAD